MKFRPCIDIKNGKVVQIIGGTLREENSSSCTNSTITNFQSENPSSFFAELYRKDGIYGGHVISLGPGNEKAVLSALKAFPGGLQVGGGINTDNAHRYLDAGASHVIVTSFVFSNGIIDMEKLNALVNKIGKDRLVLDLSCRTRDNQFWIVTDRWQKFTEVTVTEENITKLSEYCDEFLVHGVDVEGKMAGVQSDLVDLLGKCCPIPVTYAGGVKDFSDLDHVKEVGNNRVDLTIGSALDIFGGKIPYREVVKWHQTHNI
ncbi:phosphoribosylformimino-5-aminoimidazole carboxamide ribotide isomerase [Desulfamplus magnetovallimortis]|nr:phosphoribosylformimino-5-aminoimidazole carboxamide ribotide isomerase [Desulfamplus magnetovallimortis]